MWKGLGWSCLAALALLAAGCATYRPDPLLPEAEAAALDRQDLATLVPQRSTPGEGPAVPGGAPFDLSDGLNEAEVIAVALTLNPDLRAKRLESGGAQALLIEAGLWPNPEIAVAWRPGVGGATGSVVDADFLLELLRPAKRAARKDAAAASLAQVQAEIVAAEWELVAQVRRQRLAVLAGEQALALLDEEAALRDRALETTRRRRQVGEGTDVDVSAAELETVEVRRDRRKAETEFASARRELNRLLGLPSGYTLCLSESGKPLAVTVINDLADEDLGRRTRAGRFDLRAIESAYAKAEHELRLAVLRQYPDLKVGPSFDGEPDGGNFLGLGAGIAIPLSDRNQAEIAQKKNERQRARAAYVALLHRLTAAAREARGRLQRARLEVEAQEKDVLPLVRRNQDLLERGYRAGEVTVFDLIAAQQRALKARQAHLASVVRYQESVIDMETAMGLPIAQSAAEAKPAEKGE